MKKRTKYILIITSIIVVAVVVFLIVKSRSDKNESDSKSDDSERSVDEYTPPQCSNWQADAAIKQGLIISPNWVRRRPEVPECKVLGMMFYIKNNTDWGGQLNGQQLMQAAEYQASKNN